MKKNYYLYYFSLHDEIQQHYVTLVYLFCKRSSHSSSTHVHDFTDSDNATLSPGCKFIIRMWKKPTFCYQVDWMHSNSS